MTPADLAILCALFLGSLVFGAFLIDRALGADPDLERARGGWSRETYCGRAQCASHRWPR